MSSTNRGYERHKADFYVTPIHEIEKFLGEFIKVEGNIFENALNILDPCAGGADKYKMSYPNALSKFTDNFVMTVDIREDSKADLKGNYLTMEVSSKIEWDLIITNPPFYNAIDIIKKALLDTVEGGYVIMLLRLNFFESKDRFSFWQENMPKYCFVHHKRMGFIPGEPNKTDSIAYCHCVWQKGHKPEFCQLKVI